MPSYSKLGLSQNNPLSLNGSTSKTMRVFQMVAFAIGIAAFLVSACFTGSMWGDTFWKVGVAFMISNLVCILLWPAPKRP
jgi:hypothetical protein